MISRTIWLYPFFYAVEMMHRTRNMYNLNYLYYLQRGSTALWVSNYFFFSVFSLSPFLSPSPSPSSPLPLPISPILTLFLIFRISQNGTQQNSHNFYIRWNLCKFWLQIIEWFKLHRKLCSRSSTTLELSHTI